MQQRVKKVSLALALAASALFITGCASTRTIESQVQSYSTLTAQPDPATYRLERLPSQQGLRRDGAWRQRQLLEAVTTQALAEHGMQRDDANGAYRLELFSHASSHRAYWPHDLGFTWGMGYGPWGWHPVLGYYGNWRDRPPTVYVLEVRLVLRDSTGQVVYETQARYDDVWFNEAEIYRALLKAALDGFPTPAEGVRVLHHTVAP